MDPTPQPSREISFRATLRGMELSFHSTWGLFSPRAVDAGSRLLIEHLELEPQHTTLDLGCGYGVIGVTVARCCPAGQVHMVDKDFVALEYARRSAEANGVSNVRVYPSNAFSNVPPNVRFDNVVSNLPANVGAEMLSIILEDAHARLRPGGRIYLVTVSGLRRFIQRRLKDVFGNYQKVKQGATYTVALAIKADAPRV
jgi:16S rRNA G1207 methylase RsmC